MAQSFFARAGARVLNVMRTATATAVSKFSHATAAASPGPFTARVEDKSLANAAGKLEGIANVMGSGQLPRVILESLADTAKDVMKEKLEPISRTGRLRGSITSNVANNFRSEVRSSAEYADAINEGTLGVPSAQKIEKWMERKAEFSGLSGKARTRVAFAIMYSMKNKKNENKTGRSDMTKLPPTGERKYDYVGETLDEMNQEINAIGAVINAGLQT